MLIRALGFGVSALGLATALASLLADVVGVGSPGFGFVQILGTVVGVVALLVGTFVSLHQGPPWMRGMVGILSILALSTAFCLPALVWILAPFESGARFQHDQTVGLHKVYDRVVKDAGVLGTGVCRCSPDREARVRLADGFETGISIYGGMGPGPRPGIVLVHGNTWLGRNLSTYRLLASLLARRGYIVLTFDKVGFGESDDPFGRGSSAVATAYNHAEQVDAAVQYLIENTPVDRHDLSIIGHSAGVDQALYVGLAREDISRIVIMIGPLPPGEGDSSQADRSVYFTRRFRDTYRFIYGRHVPDWYTWELTGIEGSDPDYIWKRFRTSDHKPLMVVLGERDQPKGHKSVRDLFDQFVEPKKLVLVRGSNHYANTAQSLGLVFYDTAVARQLVNETVSWLAVTRSGDSTDLPPRVVPPSKLLEPE